MGVAPPLRVPDSAGTLMYNNEAQLAAAAHAKATTRASAAAHAAAAVNADAVALPPPPPPPPPEDQGGAPRAAPPISSGGGFGAKLSSFLKNKAEAVATCMEATRRASSKPRGAVLRLHAQLRRQRAATWATAATTMKTSLLRAG